MIRILIHPPPTGARSVKQLNLYSHPILGPLAVTKEDTTPAQ